ncbi:MAG TPA: NifU family protein [Bacilli bacterium]
MSEQAHNKLYNDSEEILEMLRPFLRKEGGDVEIVEAADGVVKLKMLGACGSCFETDSLREGIERALLEEVADIKEVVYIN